MSQGIHKNKLQNFKSTVWKYYKLHGRHTLPWRNTHDPYAIWLSELMLQQTQVSRVIPKYEAFLQSFPTIVFVAKAPQSEILKLWQGLGYNRRALYLHNTAKLLVKDYDGVFPKTVPELVQFPGIGKNTAGAILAYAYNIPALFIETNIRKVYLHFFFQDKINVSDSDLLPLIEQTIDSKNPREWYWALMDYGTFLSQSMSNPNIRSKHYIKQSKFVGSKRQIRGMILKKVLEHKRIKIADLVESLKEYSEGQKVLGVVEDLAAEGFLQKKNKSVLVTK